MGGERGTSGPGYPVPAHPDRLLHIPRFQSGFFPLCCFGMSKHECSPSSHHDQGLRESWLIICGFGLRHRRRCSRHRDSISRNRRLFMPFHLCSRLIVRLWSVRAQAYSRPRCWACRESGDDNMQRRLFAHTYSQLFYNWSQEGLCTASLSCGPTERAGRSR